MAPTTANRMPATTPTASGPPPRATVTAISVSPRTNVMTPTKRVEARYARSTEASLRRGRDRFCGCLRRLSGGDYAAGTVCQDGLERAPEGRPRDARTLWHRHDQRPRLDLARLLDEPAAALA